MRRENWTSTNHRKADHTATADDFKQINFVCIQTSGIKEQYKVPVVQSIVSLTSSLRGQLVKCFTTLYPNALTLKYWHILDITL